MTIPERRCGLMFAGFLLGIVHGRGPTRKAPAHLAVEGFIRYTLDEPLLDHLPRCGHPQRLERRAFGRLLRGVPGFSVAMEAFDRHRWR